MDGSEARIKVLSDFSDEKGESMDLKKKNRDYKK